MRTFPRHSAPPSHRQARLVRRSAILILAALSTLLAASTARADPPSGALFAWGNNEYWQLGLGEGGYYDQPLPVRLDAPNDFVAISCGTLHTLALRADGTVWVWGEDRAVQLRATSGYDFYVPIQIAGLGGVVSIAAGPHDSVVLKDDGTVWAWGYNTTVPTGDDSMDWFRVPTKVEGLANVVAVAAGDAYGLALKQDGSVWGWGLSQYGRLGPLAAPEWSPLVRITGLPHITAIEAGLWHALALADDGSVWAWGYNPHGELGDGTTDDRAVPAPIAGLSDIVAVAAGATHCAAVTREGAVWTWGYNSHGELGDGTTKTRLRPMQVAGLDGVARVAAGENHTLALKYDGTLWAWGSNHSGELGSDLPPYKFYAPVQVTALAGVLDVSADYGFTVAIGELSQYTVSVEAVPPEGGTVAITPLKKNSRYDFGDIVTVEATTNVGWVFRGWEGLSPEPDDPGAERITFEVRSDLSITARFEPFRPTLTVAVVPREGAIVERVPDKATYDYGETVTVTVRPAEGYDFLRWLGLPPEAGLDPTEQTISLTLTNHTLVTACLSGQEDSQSGVVWAWGSNNYGQLGNGTNQRSDVPVQVVGLTGVVAVSAGTDHALALRSDGTVWAWGNNLYGQVGEVPDIRVYRPVRVAGLNNVVAITAGIMCSLAVKADGTVWGWGANVYGELGEGAPTYHRTPVQIHGFPNIATVVTGSLATWALAKDGTVWACGWNKDGRLGDGTSTDRPTPVQLPGLSEIKAVAPNAYGVLALKQDGTVWTCGKVWGPNSKSGFIVRPVKVPDVSNIVGLSPKWGFSGLRADGKVVSWSSHDLYRHFFEGSSQPIASWPFASLPDIPRLTPEGGLELPLLRDGSLWTWRWYSPDFYDNPGWFAERVPGLINITSADKGAFFYVAVGDYVPNTLDIKAEVGPAANWVYQNTPRSVDGGGHALRLEVTVLDDSGNSHFEVSAEKAAGSGTGEIFVTDDPAGDPLVKYVAGSMRTDGREGTGPLALSVKVTGLQNGHSRIVELPLTVRPLGDVDGNGGVEPQDAMALIRSLNGNPPPGFEDRAFDLDANGAADMADFQVLMNILNGRPIP